MADDIQQKPLTQEEQEWMNAPVSVQVAPDNQQWLSTLLEMKPDELQNYAIYNYQVPVEAAKAVGRNDLVQLIVTANLAGQTGSSVLRTKYRYLPQLRTIMPPEVTTRRGRLLYLTRGEADTMQVRDKRTDEWKSYRELVPTDKDVARTMAESGAGFVNEFNPRAQRELNKGSNSQVEGSPTVTPAAPEQPGLPPEVILAALPKMNRGDLEKVASSLGASDVSDAKFPNAGSLRDYIETALKAKQPAEV